MGAASAVVVIDDDEELRDLLEALLALDGRFEVSASAADPAAGIAAVDLVRPAAAIVDLEIGEAPDLIDTIRELSPDTKIVVLSMFPDPYTLLDVVQRGADAYLDRATSWLELIPTIVSLCGIGAIEVT